MGHPVYIYICVCTCEYIITFIILFHRNEPAFLKCESVFFNRNFSCNYHLIKGSEVVWFLHERGGSTEVTGQAGERTNNGYEVIRMVLISESNHSPCQK